jgi:hypothetical protein
MQLLHLANMRASTKYAKLLEEASWFETQKKELTNKCQEGQSWNLGDQVGRLLGEFNPLTSKCSQCRQCPIAYR